MATLFTRILNKELPGHFVYLDDVCGAFLSIAPLQAGHTLVVPRHEVDHWLDLPAEELAHCMEVARKIGQAQMQAFKARKIGMMVAGLEVPHVHIHVVPMQDESDLDFAKAKEVPQEELAAAAEAIKKYLK